MFLVNGPLDPEESPDDSHFFKGVKSSEPTPPSPLQLITNFTMKHKKKQLSQVYLRMVKGVNIRITLEHARKIKR